MNCMFGPAIGTVGQWLCGCAPCVWRRDLRADALRVAASRQVNQSGAWVDAPVKAATVQKLEDIILTRARDLRRTAVGG